MRLFRTLALGTAAVAAIAAAGPAAAQFGRFLPGRGYAVDGERGPLLSQVDPAEISQRLGSGDALGFASEAGNQGSHHGLRLPMPRTEAAIAAMIQRMDGVWPHDPRRPVEVHILASGFYTPMALPDGSIMVPLGLLEQVETDDELAYILGHELSHVRLGHFADDQGFRQQRQTGQRLAQAYSVAATLSQLRTDTSGGFRTYAADLGQAQRDQTRAAAAAEYLNVIVNVFAEPAWARGQEDEADALAFDLAEGAGYNGLDGADAAFGRMEADFDLRRSSAVAMEAQLNETVAEAVTSENVLSAVGGDEGEGFLRSLASSFARRGARRGFELASGYFGQRHRPPDARSEGLSNYADEAYPDRSGFMDTQDAALQAIRAEGEYQQALEAVGAMQAAQERRLDGDIPGALSEIARAQATQFGHTPAVSNAAAALHADAGDIDEADRLYSQAHMSAEDSLEGYVAHVNMLIRAGRRDRARQIIGEGAARYGGGDLGEKAFLPSLIAVSFLDGHENEGVAYLRRCMNYAEERLSQDCTIAATSPGDPQRYDSLSPEARREVDATLRNNRTSGPDLNDLGSAVNALGGLFGRGG